LSNDQAQVTQDTQVEMDRAERRATIRESNQKLDQAVEHLSDVLSHLKIQDNHREFASSLNNLRTTLVIGFTLTWLALLAFAVLAFVHVRDNAAQATDHKVYELKLENIEKDIVAIKHKDELLESKVKEHNSEHK
jgi:hypothetical protein